MILLLISIILFFISYYFLPKRNIFLVIFLLISLFYFGFSLFFIIGNYFTGKGIDESVLYQLSFGVKGSGVDLKLIFIIIFSIIFYIGTLVFFYFGKKKKNSPEKNKIFLLFFVLFLSFLYHPVFYNFYTMGFFSVSADKNHISYEIPELKIKDLDTKNLIYIYLESFENLYLDENIFPGVAKNLQNLKENSIYFENVEQAFGTSWTIAGMVGSQCGIPLINSGGGGNSMYGIKDFLPGAFCLGDYLKKAGYNLSYIGGADLAFAGKGNFYKTHGFNNVFGRYELEKNMSDKNYRNYWGIYDDVLFDFIFKEYERLSSKNEKFGLFSITLDTHLNDAFVSKSCPKKEFDKEILKSYHCSDFLLSKFLNKIINHKNFKNTIIVISSDHYAMNANSTIDILNKNKEKRRNLFLIIDGKEKQKIYKKATTLDIGATVLNKLGFDIERLGFGVNIFSDYIGLENINLKNHRNLFESFWKFPSLKNGINFNFETKKVFINGKEISFPALVTLNKNKDTEKILWEDIGNGKLKDKIKENSIYFSFYKGGKFCLNFGNKIEKCFTETGKISYEDILKEFE